MDNRGNIVIYQTKDGKTSIDVKLEDETVRQGKRTLQGVCFSSGPYYNGRAG